MTDKPHGGGSTIWIAGGLLALMPVLSFVLQYQLDGPDRRMFQNFTVAYVDWIFVPFNLLVVHAIDWRRGATIFAITVIAVAGNTAVHAFWQSLLPDPGYMFSAERQVLPSGWAHLVYSTLQMILVLAFVFARREHARFLRTTTGLAAVYLLAAGVSGYLINHGFMVTDVGLVLLGLFSVLVAPRWFSSTRSAGLL